MLSGGGSEEHCTDREQTFAQLVIMSVLFCSERKTAKRSNETELTDDTTDAGRYQIHEFPI